MALTKAQSPSKKASKPAPVTLETGRIGAASKKRPPQKAGQVRADPLEVVRADAVDLRQRHQAVPNAQQREDIQVLAGLGHDAVVGGHHEDHAVHAAGPGDHRLDEVLMAGNIDDAHLHVGDLAGGEAEVDRHPPLFLLLEPVGLAAGQRFHQRGLAVVDVAGGAQGDVDLLRGHGGK